MKSKIILPTRLGGFTYVKGTTHNMKRAVQSMKVRL
jgi:hypothetical protein